MEAKDFMIKHSRKTIRTAVSKTHKATVHLSYYYWHRFSSMSLEQVQLHPRIFKCDHLIRMNCQTKRKITEGDFTLVKLLVSSGYVVADIHLSSKAEGMEWPLHL